MRAQAMFQRTKCEQQNCLIRQSLDLTGFNFFEHPRGIDPNLQPTEKKVHLVWLLINTTITVMVDVFYGFITSIYEMSEHQFLYDLYLKCEHLIFLLTFCAQQIITSGSTFMDKDDPGSPTDSLLVINLRYFHSDRITLFWCSNFKKLPLPCASLPESLFLLLHSYEYLIKTNS